MTRDQLKATRVLLLALHEQADRNARLRPRMAAFRTALACVELVQRAMDERASADSPATIPGDFGPTAYAAGYSPTIQHTMRAPYEPTPLAIHRR